MPDMPQKIKSDTIRTFISIPVPFFDRMKEVSEQLGSTGCVSLSTTAPHITVRFLGDLGIDMAGRLTDVMDRVGKNNAFDVCIKGMGAFPDMRDPRIIFAKAHFGNGFEEVYNDIIDILDGLGIDYDRKDFNAHATLGRVRKDCPAVNDIMIANEDTLFGSFLCSEIIIMRSTLGPAGTVHDIISTVLLR